MEFLRKCGQGLFLLSLVAVPAFLIFTPASSMESMSSLCLWKGIFHAECPGCGITRAFSSVLHGNFMEAYDYHRLIPLLFPLGLWVWFRAVWREGKKLNLGRKTPDLGERN